MLLSTVGIDKRPLVGYVAPVTWTIPNQITLARILAIPLFMYFLFAEGTVFKILALAIFAAAAISDAVDGYLARSLRQVTPFGVFADPIADKLLLTAAVVSFVQLGELTAVPVVVILAREFLVTGLRILAMAERIVIPASPLGKLKTLSHIGLVLFILATRYFGLGPTGQALKDVFLYLAVALALISGAEYFWRVRDLFRGSPRATSR
jgi:CDP-diacylglycerol--glycerol-3-phosphate 3-phosphatidyltransferase